MQLLIVETDGTMFCDGGGGVPPPTDKLQGRNTVQLVVTLIKRNKHCNNNLGMDSKCIK